ncbi:hypothetical protein [Mycobacterium tuberculosis]|uniref:hypothetical protein n=1 Tax=Mycobacterium tuberculosis TaxID=1773 RepID=UPI0034586CCC
MAGPGGAGGSGGWLLGTGGVAGVGGLGAAPVGRRGWWARGCWVLAGTAAPAGLAPSPVGSGELAEPGAAGRPGVVSRGTGDVLSHDGAGSVGLAGNARAAVSVPAAPVDPAEGRS